MPRQPRKRPRGDGKPMRVPLPALPPLAGGEWPLLKLRLATRTADASATGRFARGRPNEVTMAKRSKKTKPGTGQGTKNNGTKKRRRRGKSSSPATGIVEDIPLHVTARRRYLNYAMSVITARALPDVRDGLKPVQRRILYTMQHELHLGPASKPLKCARIVGDVLGKFHPHGDTAVYDALVRMAQDFSLRYPLVDGHGNFGSLDGDRAAAYRYTEATLRQLSTELLQELPRETVDYRPNYDGKTREPIVLPARIPNLLINGTTGIAVGMATNIPPHNLGEVTEACEALIKDRKLAVADLVRIIKGPDFPTGGQILNSPAELRAIYEEGQGSVRLRGEYQGEKGGRDQRIVVTSIPYMVQKDVLVRSIGDLIVGRKVPQLVDVRDESTGDVRIVLELKKDADPDVVMAYLYKNTALQNNFNVNLTCLVPTDDGRVDATTPARVDLKMMLLHFIEFRYTVVERRFQFDVRQLKERIHLLEGYRKVFRALDDAIRIIRGSDGRPDATEKLRARFKLDEPQAAAILDLRLYKLARLEVEAILDELREKKAEATRIEKILSSPRRLWTVVRKEIVEVRENYADPRRTKVGGRAAQEVDYSEEEFIEDEDAYIVLSHDGWVKRVGRVTDTSKVRLRPGDELLEILAGNTRCSAVFFSNLGSAYTLRIHDIPPSRGYGDPVQKLFKFRDGERVVAALSLDPRLVSDIGSPDDPEGTVPRSHLLVVGSGGYALRCSIASFIEPSTRTGRKFARVKEGEEIIGVHVAHEEDVVMVASREGRVLLFRAALVKFLSGAGRGVIGIKLGKGDRLIAWRLSRGPKDALVVYTTGNRRVEVSQRRYSVTGRGGKGTEVIRRGGLSRVEPPEIVLPDLQEENGDHGKAAGAAAEKSSKKTSKKSGKKGGKSTKRK
ncbi:MAG: DNA topoisomerase IV subunit A [Planctomycetota bacterium]|nr:DNA topoisomerase IV subunit A [Planctomycetota bacterium]